MIHLKTNPSTEKYDFPLDARDVPIEVCSKCLALALAEHNRLVDKVDSIKGDYNIAAETLSRGVESAQALEDALANSSMKQSKAARMAKEHTASLMPPEGFNEKVYAGNLIDSIVRIFSI